jgi:hypothetical protein
MPERFVRVADHRGDQMPPTATIIDPAQRASVERRSAALIVSDAAPSALLSAAALGLARRVSVVEVVVVAADHPLMSAMHVVDAHLCLVPDGLVDVGDWAREEAERADAVLHDAVCALTSAGLRADGHTSTAPAHRVLRSFALRPEPPAIVVLAQVRHRRADARAAGRAEQRGIVVEVLTAAPSRSDRMLAGSTRR